NIKINISHLLQRFVIDRLECGVGIGFYYLTLYCEPNGLQTVRIHVYDTNKLGFDNRIHSHSRDVCSRILRVGNGFYTDQTLFYPEVSKCSQNNLRCLDINPIHVDSKCIGANFSETNNSIESLVKKRRLLPRDSSIFIPQGVFHKLHRFPKGTITVCCFGKKSGKSQVLDTIGFESQSQIVRPRLSESSVKKVIKQHLRSLLSD
ncbi:MAG: hypothetical protein AAGF07_02490, partial [Patescibacteria group bacterium]